MKTSSLNGCAYAFLEEIDLLVAASYANARATDPTNFHTRFRLFVLFLERTGFTAPGFNFQRIRNQLKQQLKADEWNELQTGLQRIRDLLGCLLDPTYTVTSYWSPLDTKRHSVLHQPEVDHKARKEAIASAYAFFALTFKGAPKRNPDELYSATQYISLHARRKRGFPLCFRDDAPEIQHRWWHIPDSIHEPLMKQSGLKVALERVLLSKSFNELEEELHRVLVNDPVEGWNDIDGFAENWLAQFAQCKLRPFLERFIEQMRLLIIEQFGNQITRNQALFMVLTHILWRRACPGTDFAYTFPTLVQGTCCVFTVGSREPLPDEALLQTSLFAKSLFIHPLLADYTNKGVFLGTLSDRKMLELREQDPKFGDVVEREVTICFWDIRKFSAISERFKTTHTEVAAFLRDFNNAAAEIIYLNDGILDKFIGDGVMALFGAHVSCCPSKDCGKVIRNGARSAARTALQLREAFEVVLKKHPAIGSNKTEIGLGCGINTGEALVGIFGGDQRRHFTALGNSVNLAQRFESRARGGEILVSEKTMKLIDGVVDAKLVEMTRDIKNIEDTVYLYNVIGRKAKG